MSIALILNVNSFFKKVSSVNRAKISSNKLGATNQLQLKNIGSVIQYY